MQKIEIKIIISIFLFTLFIVVLQRYQLSESIIEQFKESKKERNDLLVNTVAPVIGLNLSLGLEASYHAYLDEIAIDNQDIEYIKFTGIDGNSLYTFKAFDKANIMKKSINYVQKDIVDSLTSEKIAFLEISFSNDDYEVMLTKNSLITKNIFIITTFLLLLFLIYIKREFKVLKDLTNNVLIYDPQRNNFPLQRLNTNDEVSLINNAIISMVKKINSYTALLDETNESLEEKVKERTHELEVQTRRAEELVSIKSHFLANMSHEIRTPMNAIVGMIYLIQETPLNEKQSKYLQKIKQVSNNLLFIINDILDFSKLEAGKFKLEFISFDMHNVVEVLNNLFEYKAKEKGLGFKIELIGENTFFYGDPFRIEQVLINLISNAIKFTDKGEVSLSIKLLSTKEVEFVVKDSGIGIEKEKQLKLFEPFTQADESTTREYGGTGLGLSISKQILEQMDSIIHVYSEIGKGSKFSFKISLQKSKSSTNEYKQTQKVYNKIETKIVGIESKILTKEEENLLFRELLQAAKTKLPKKCEPIILEIDKCVLGKKEAEMFFEIKQLCKVYKFKKMIALLEKNDE